MQCICTELKPSRDHQSLFEMSALDHRVFRHEIVDCFPACNACTRGKSQIDFQESSQSQHRIIPSLWLANRLELDDRFDSLLWLNKSFINISTKLSANKIYYML